MLWTVRAVYIIFKLKLSLFTKNRHQIYNTKPQQHKYNSVQWIYKNQVKMKVPDHKINSTKRNRRKSDDAQSSFTASRRSYTSRRSTHALRAIQRPEAVRDRCLPSIDDPSGRPNRQTVQKSSVILEHTKRLQTSWRHSSTSAQCWTTFNGLLRWSHCRLHNQR